MNRSKLQTLIFLLLLTCLATGASYAVATEWNGPVSSAWNNPGNWNNGVPDSTKDVVIKAGTFNPIVPSGTYHILNLDVQAGGVLNLAPGAILVVHGTNIQRNSGTINLGSGQIIFTNDVEIKNGGVLDAGSGTVTMTGGTWQNEPGSTFIPGTSTFEIDGDGTQTIVGDMSFFNLEITNSASTVTFEDDVVIDGLLVVTDSALLVTDGTLNVSNEGEYCVEGNLTVNGSYNNNGLEVCEDGSITSTSIYIVSVAAINATTVDVTFDRAVHLTTAQTSSNYGIGGITVNSATRSVTDNSVVRLSVSSMTSGSQYTMTIANVRDSSGTLGSAIASGSTRNFSYGTSPVSIRALFGTPQSAQAGYSFARTLRAIVEDSYSLPVYNATVTYTAPASGASGTFAASGTNSTTVATAGTGFSSPMAFTANGITGSYTVAATVGGVGSPANYSLTNTPGPATQLGFVQQPTDAGMGVAISPAVTVQLLDVSGNPVPGSGVSITMALSSGTGTLSGTTTQTTNGVGLATFSNLSIDIQGSKALTASSTGLTSAVSSAFAILNPAPTTTGLTTVSAIVGTAAFTDTITGTNFISSSVVRVGGADRATTYIDGMNLAFQFQASDLASAGTLSLTVFTPAPGGGISGVQIFTVNNPVPATTSLTRTSAAAGAAAFTDTVNGTNFVSSSTVQVDGNDRATTHINSTSVSFQFQAADLSSAGTLSITVTSPAPGGGTSNPQSFAVSNPIPTTTSLTTASATAGAAAFSDTISGTNFVAGSAVQVGGANRTTTYINSTTLSFQFQASDLATGGTLSVTVVNPAPGGGTSNAQTFTVNNLTPSTTSLTTATGLVGASAFTDTINGTNFVSTSVVQVDGNSRTTTFINSTALAFQFEASDLASTGNLSVTVVNPAPGGGTSNAQGFAVNNPVPVTTSLTESNAQVGAAAFTDTVNGTNFLATSTVQVNGADRATTYLSSTMLSFQFQVADLAVGAVLSVTVVNPAPGGGISNAQSFAVGNPIPVTTSLTTASALLGAAAFTDTVNGSDFVNGAVVKVGGDDRATTFIDNNEVSFIFLASDLASAGALAITVVNPVPGGGTSNAQTFTVNNPAPTTTSLTTASIVAGAGAITDTVNGTNFLSSSTVQVDGAGRTTTYISSTALSFQFQASDFAAGGTLSITVVNPAPGGGTSNAQTFTVNNPVPTTTGLTTAGALAGAAAFTDTLTGTNFVSTSTVQVGGDDRVTTFINSTSLSFQFQAADIATAGTLSITVVNPAPAGGASNAQTLTVTNPVPATSGFTTASIEVGSPGFTDTLNGTDFVATSTVQVGGSDRVTTYISGTALSFVFQASDLAAVGTLSVTVVNPPPGGGTSNAQTFTVTPGAVNNFFVEAAGGGLIGTQTAGTPFDITITARDAGNNTATAFTGTVDLTSSGSILAGGGTTAAFTAGVLTSHSISLSSAGSFTLIATNTAGSETGASNTFTVEPASLDHYSVEAAGGGLIGPQAAGTPFDIGIDARDAYENIVTSFTGTTTISSTGALSAGSGITAAFTAGTLPSHSVTFSNTGSFTITATNTAGLETGTSNTFAVGSGVLDHFVVETSGGGAIGPQAAGTPFSLRITAQDANNNTVTSFTGTTDMTSTGTLSSGGGTSGAFTAGVLAAHSVTISNVGSFTLTATHTSGIETGTSNAFTVDPGVVDHFLVEAQGGGAIGAQDASVPFTIAVTALDANDNVVTGFAGTVDISSTGTLTAGSGTTLAFVAGVLASHSVTIGNAGTFTLTATKTGDTEAGTSASFIVSNPAPTLGSIDQTTGSIFQTLSVLFTGTNFVDGSVTVDFGAGVTVNSLVVNSSTQVTVSITITAAASAGAHDVSITNAGPGGGTATLPGFFSVSNPAPTLMALDIVTGARLQTMNVVLTGTNYIGGTTTVSFGADVTVNSVLVSGPTQLTANITIAATATTGARSVNVTNAAPGGGAGTLAASFSISNPVPTLTLLGTSSGTRLQTLNVVLTGTNFIDGVTLADFGSNIVMNSVTVTSSTELTANISITSTAATGARSVTVTNSAPGGGAATLAGAFTVGNPSPTFTGMSLASGETFQTLGITFTGTNFINGVTTVSFGSGITVSSLTVVSSTQLSASVTISSSAATGARNVTITNAAPDGGSATLTNGFTVIAPVPTLTSINIPGGTLYQSLTITFTGTNFVNGITSVSFGSGITVHSATVSSPTQLAASVSITSAATTGARSASVINSAPGGGIATLAGAFTVTNPVPAIASVSPSSRPTGGPAFTMIVNGNNFAPGAVARYDGAARTTTFVDSSRLSVAILAADIAALGTYPISVVNPAPGGGTSNGQAFEVSLVYPEPVISAVSPVNVMVKGNEFVLTVDGSDFVTSSVVRFEGSDRATTYVNASQLTAIIPAADIQLAGNYAITVVTPAPGGGTSNSVTLPVLGSTIAGTLFNDRDGDGSQGAGENGVTGWTLTLEAGNPANNQTSTTEPGGAFRFENLPNDSYTVSVGIEAGWIATIPASASFSTSVASPTDVGGVTFGVNTEKDTAMFRTFSTEDLSIKKTVRKKFVATEWTFEITKPEGFEANGLRVYFTADICDLTDYEPFTGVQVVGESEKIIDFTGAEIGDEETVSITGISCKAGKMNVLRWWWLLDGTPVSFGSNGTAVLRPVWIHYLYAMPNVANVREEVFKKGGFAATANKLIVGIPRTDSPKHYGWAAIRSGSNLYNSLYDRSGGHVNQARGFTVFQNGKRIVGAQAKVAPSKHNNVLFAELAALKLNIAASALGITPVGFGELVFDDGVNPLSGLTVAELAHHADSMMTFWRGHSLSEYQTLSDAIGAINGAFSGPIDTLSYQTILRLTPVAALSDIPFLRADPKNTPVTIVASDVEIDESEESDGDDDEEADLDEKERKDVTRDEEGEPEQPYEEETVGTAVTLPTHMALYQNYPNPFNPSTAISFDLSQSSLVTLNVYDMMGQVIATLADREPMEQGTRTIEFDASELPSGVYHYRFTAEPVGETGDTSSSSVFSVSKKMVLLK